MEKPWAKQDSGLDRAYYGSP